MKNQIIKINDQDVKLIKKIGEGNFATIYQTSQNCVAKITYKSNTNGFKSYQNELNVFKKLSQQSNEGIIGFRGQSETNLNGEPVAIILLELCNRGTLIDLLTTLPNFKPHEQLVLMVLRDVCVGIINLHKVTSFDLQQIGVTHRDIKMENILLSTQGSACLQTWTVTNQNTLELQDDIERNTTPFYRAPEQLDFYSGFPINEKVDIFALGVMIYIFCFQKPPFESSLAAINTHYFLPDKYQYSQELINLIKLMFEPNPSKRPTAQSVLEIIQKGWTIPNFYIKTEQIEYKQSLENIEKQFKTVDNIYLISSENQLSILDKTKRYFNELTQTTQAWVMQATEDNDLPPRSQEVKSLIVKAWFKKDKISKFYSAVQSKVIVAQIQRKRVILKLLILLHQYIKKGPAEILKVDKSKMSNPGFQSILRAIIQRYQSKQQSKDFDDDDELILTYSSQLLEKSKLSLKYQKLFEGNFSANPLFQTLQNGQAWEPINLQMLVDLQEYWQQTNDLVGKIIQNPQKSLKTTSVNIKLALILQIVDELYCLLSLFIHLIYAVKNSTNFINHPVDKNRLTERLLKLELNFEDNFLSTKVKILIESKNIYDKLRDFPEYHKISELIPYLYPSVIKYIKDLEFLQDNPNKLPFKIIQYFNPQNKIQGISLPSSYQMVITEQMNVIQNLISLKEFNQEKIIKQPQNFDADFPQPSQIEPNGQKYNQEYDFFADFQGKNIRQPQNFEVDFSQLQPKVEPDGKKYQEVDFFADFS